MKQVDVAIAMVIRGSSVLICQRKPDAPLGGLWEFPGGKIEAGESAEQCAVREVMEEVGLTIAVRRQLDVIEYGYPGTHVRLHPFLCSHVAGEAQAIGCQQAKWVQAEELAEHRFPLANDPLLDELRSCLPRGIG